MLNQAPATKKNQDLIVITKLTEDQTIEIPKEKWTEFLNDFSKRRFGWKTKIEILDESVGDQNLSEGLILNGIINKDKSGNCKIEISLGENIVHHHTHTITQPVKIAYLRETDSKVGVLEIIEATNTKTLISLMHPMPIFMNNEFPKTTSAIGTGKKGK